MFPFDTFFMAFPEEEGLSLFIYHPKGSLQETKLLVRGKLIRELVEQLGLPSGILIDVDEFVIDTVSPLPVPIDDIETIMVPLKNREMCDWAGFIGVGYATAREALTLQEESVVRSILGVMVMVVGSSKALSRTLTELEYYSNHDPLTGLYNRRYFNEMLDYEVGRSECHKHEFSILMLDMDNFKDVNDTYGHPCGDVALKQMAETIHASMRKGDLATRIGGDEFAIILAETGKSGALAVAEKLRKQLREITFQSPEGKRFHVTTSIGLITYPEDAQNISDLMSGVDMGLYRAKEMGKDGICMLDSIEHIQAGRTTRDHAEKLRDALKGDRVVPYFQPIFDCRSKKIFAFETLARLVEPNGEIITAGMFIETIEKYGMGRELDRAVIEKSLSVMKRQIDLNGVSCRLFINLSAQEIQGRGVLGFAEQLCSTLEIPPKNVVFEILERDAISDMTHMRKFLSDLGRKGFSFALDDFGSGYNSFHYLRELHFDYVKIDGAFVRNILNSKIDYALVRNLSHLCQDIGILTIAEFVESDEILEALRDMGIDYAQGYHLGMPTSQLSNSPHALEPEHQRAAPGQTQAGVISGSATYR